VQSTRLGWLKGLGPLHLWGGVARPFDARLGACHAVALASHVATVGAVVSLVLRSVAWRIADSPDAGDVEFVAPLGLDAALLYFTRDALQRRIRCMRRHAANARGRARKGVAVAATQRTRSNNERVTQLSGGVFSKSTAS